MNRTEWPKARLRGILFDFYNTLGTAVDPSAGLLRSTLARFGYSFPTDVLNSAMHRAWQPFNGAELVEHVDHSSSAESYRNWRSRIELAWLVQLGVDPCPVDLLHAICAANDDPVGFRLFDDVRPVMETLHGQGYALGVVSNWGWELREIFERERIDHLFDAIVASARCGYRKPHPGIYRHALQALGLEPHEVLFVGDNPHTDFEGPARVGIHAILIDRCGPATGQETQINGLQELLERLK
ncbi:MAG: HAD family hydrolase [Dehalococcoidia bacterium]